MTAASDAPVRRRRWRAALAAAIGALLLSSCRTVPAESPCRFSGAPRSTIAWQSGGGTGGELRGRVVWTGSGEPLPDAHIVVEPGGHHARADSAGRFSLTGLPHGTYEIRIRRIALLEARDSVALGADGLTLLAALASPTGDVACVQVVRP